MIPKRPAGRAWFDSTRWSIVRRAGGAGSDEARCALGELIETYWYPLYAFARRQGHGDSDAMDFCQGYFTELIEGQELARVSEDKGRFRSFLLASFRNFIANQLRGARAIKRGGSVSTTSLNGIDFEARYDREPAELVTPETLFDHAWIESLLAVVRKRLSEEYDVAGKTILFAMLEPHLAGNTDAAPKAQISEVLKLSPAAVAMSLYRMRRRFGELLREEIANTVSDPSQVEDELHALMASFERRL